MIRVKSFLDQDSSRKSVGLICGKFAVEAVSLLDSATSSDFDENSPGPQISLLAQSFVVGPILGCMQFTEDGLVDIDTDLGPVERELERMSTKEGRAKWLLSEIPRLNAVYGQLYDGEKVEALALCSSLQSDPANTLASLPALEAWYDLSQPGSRLMRDDEDAIKHAEDSLKRAREVVSAENDRLIAEQASIDAGLTDGEKSSQAVSRLNKELDSVDASMYALSREIEILNSERSRILDNLDFAEEAQNAV